MAESNTGVVTRTTWIDIAKGIGIILVVLGHVARGLDTSGILVRDTTFQWLDFTLYSFHMPLFFLLAGLTVERSLQKGKRTFLSGKVFTIVYPYILWSILQGLIQFALSTMVNSPKSLISAFALWDPMASHFWFLYALMLCHLIIALWPLKREYLIALAVLLLLIAELTPEHSRSQWDIGFKTMHLFVFFIAGYFLSKHIAALHMGWVAGGGLILAFIVAILASEQVSQFDYETLSILPASFLGVAMVIWLSMRLKGPVASTLSSIGVMSLTIYVMHIIFGSAVRIVLSKFLKIDNVSLHLIAGTVIGIGAPIVAHLVMRRLNLLPLFGLAPPRWLKSGKRDEPVPATGG